MRQVSAAMAFGAVVMTAMPVIAKAESNSGIAAVRGEVSIETNGNGPHLLTQLQGS